MMLRFAVRNFGDTPAALSTGDVVDSDSLGERDYSAEELKKIMPELQARGLRPFLLVPCKGPEEPRPRPRRHAPTEMQRALHHRLTGQHLPADATGAEAGERIDEIIRREQADEAAPPPPKARARSAKGRQPIRPPREVSIIPNRFYICAPPAVPIAMAYTLVVNWTKKSIPRQGYAVLECEPTDNVDMKFISGVVRLISSTIKGVEQRVLVYAEPDCTQTIAGCVLREFLGLSPEDALKILRRRVPGALMKPELRATLERYRPS